MIAAMGLDGVRAPLAFPGATNAATFQTYVEQVLVPALREATWWSSTIWLPPGPAVSEAIERAGASVLPLPPYSPDFKPIEGMFSKFKGFLRRLGVRTKVQLYDAIGDPLEKSPTRISWAGFDMPDCAQLNREPP